MRQSQTAQSRELAAAANSQLDADPELSALLAAEGARIAPSSQATAALRTALSASHLDAQARLAGHPARPARAQCRRALRPPRRTRRRRPRRRPARRLGGGASCARAGLPKAQPNYYDAGPDFAAAFSSDGRHVATVSFDGDARVWDWRARRVVATRSGVGKIRLAFSPDGRVLAAGATLWDWRRDAARRLEGIDEDAFHSLVAFAPSGRYVAGVEVFGGTRVWDVRTRRTVARLPAAENDDATESVAFSPDARRLVRGTSDGVAEVWDWRARRRLAGLRPGGAFAETSFTEDGAVVLVGTTDGQDLRLGLGGGLGRQRAARASRTRGRARACAGRPRDLDRDATARSGAGGCRRGASRCPARGSAS